MLWRKYLFKMFLTGLSISTIFPIAVSCGDVPEIRLKKELANENKEKQNFILETIVKFQDAQNKQDTYQTFTSTYLATNNDKYYFLTSRGDLKNLNQKTINISLTNTNLENNYPLYFFSGEVIFDIVLNHENYIVYAIEKSKLSSSWGDRLIQAPNHGGEPIRNEFSNNHNVIEQINSARSLDLNIDEVISYTPIQPTSILYKQIYFGMFKSIHSSITALSSEIKKTDQTVTYNHPAHINNQFFGSPLFHNSKIVGILNKYQNYLINSKDYYKVTFYIFNLDDIQKIRQVVTT